MSRPHGAQIRGFAEGNSAVLGLWRNVAEAEAWLDASRTIAVGDKVTLESRDGGVTAYTKSSQT